MNPRYKMFLDKTGLSETQVSRITNVEYMTWIRCAMNAFEKQNDRKLAYGEPTAEFDNFLSLFPVSEEINKNLGINA